MSKVTWRLKRILQGLKSRVHLSEDCTEFMSKDGTIRIANLSEGRLKTRKPKRLSISGPKFIPACMVSPHI